MSGSPPNTQTATTIELAHQKALVTGGAGFIGSHLVQELVRGGAHVVVVDNLQTGRLENLSGCLDRIEFFHEDVLDEPFLDLLDGGEFDVIYHLAANSYVPPSVDDPAFDLHNNLSSTFRILEQMRHSRSAARFILASSGAVYGNPVRLPIHEGDPTFPVSPYGVSKLAAERYVDVFCRLYDLRGASARLFSTFGPRQTKQIVYDFLEKLNADPTTLFIYGDGSQTRDFNFVTNVVDALLLVAQRGDLRGEVYNVAVGRENSVRELAVALCERLGLEPGLAYSGSVRPGDAEKWQVDIGRLKSLGYEARVSLEEGLVQTIDWYRAWKSGRPAAP